MEKAFQTYLFHYQHEGATWLLELKADSMDDAKRRLSRLQFASYEGKLAYKVHVPSKFSGLLAPVVSFVLRLLGSDRTN